MSDDKVNIAFLMIPGFALTSFALAVEAFSVANRLAATPAYAPAFYHDGRDDGQQTVTSSNQVPVLTSHSFVRDEVDCSVVFICAYQGAALYQYKPVLQKLNRLQRRGCRIAALTSGSFILAKAGLMKHSSCTVVPEQQAVFHELYPETGLQENLFTVNGNILTCAGGMSALDMALYLIALDHGSNFAACVSEQFLQERMRSEKETQRTSRYIRLRMKSAALGAAVEVMENNIEHPCSIAELAVKIGTTPRTLENAFRRHEHTTPNAYYLKLRLGHAYRMIQETQLPLKVIAAATGFGSQSYFTKRFREVYGVQPGQLRTQVI
ncbi:MAG: helix-turn-helix domain-containing protein [Thiolinea sp.]